MTKARKVVTVFGTRPEAIKLFPLIHTLSTDSRFSSCICVSGQHREMLDQVLTLADLRPDHDLAVMTPGQSLDALFGAMVLGIGRVLDLERPDWVVVQGDTATALAGALAAYHGRVPVVHVEAGLRSGDLLQPWPEEGNRRMIGTIAALHCAPTETAAAALRAENILPGTVHMTGNTVVDALHWVMAEIARKPGIAGGLDGLAKRFADRRVIGVTMHRRESIGPAMRRITRALRRIAARDDVAIVLPLHLNSEVRRIVIDGVSDLENVALMEPLDYPHFARLLDMATLMLTDSGGVQEEAPALGKPVLVMRETTERPEGVAAGTAKLVGTDTDRIVAEVTKLLDDGNAYSAMARAHNPFGDGRASGRIVELLARGPQAVGQTPA